MDQELLTVLVIKKKLVNVQQVQLVEFYQVTKKQHVNVLQHVKNLQEEKL
jgi:hypothetical protein